MTEHPQSLSKGQAIERLLIESFPDLRCLRCGNDAFALTYDMESEFSISAKKALVSTAAESASDEVLDVEGDMLREILDGALITLVCERCGMIERHLRPTLERSEKPIKIEVAGDDELPGR